MRRTLPFAAALAAAFLFPAAAAIAAAPAASPPVDADARAAIARAVDETVARYGLPGIAVGVIEDGRVVAVETRGELAAGAGQPVTSATLFKIASNTKAMTAAVLARLVDQGRLRWDDPVVKHLPQFRMHDPWVTVNMQVRDLLIHNSGLGLGAGDLMLWPEPNTFTRADVIAGLEHLKPVTSFRSGYAYDNLLYVVAGELAAAVAGVPYDELVRREIFVPLGMEGCRVGSWRLDQAGSVALPHRRVDGRNMPMDERGRGDGGMVPDITSMAAGGIRCGVDDMLKWMRMWLDPPDPWLSPGQRRAVWTAHMPMPVSTRMREWDGTHFSAYGYGWRLSDVGGEWKVAHTGTLDGMYSSLVLLPDRRSGFVILINGEGEAARTALGQALLQRYTDPASGHGVAHYAGLLERERAQRAEAQPLPDTSSRRPARRDEAAPLLGVWRDPWFGEVALCPRTDGIGFVSTRSPLMAGRVMRLADGRWLVDWDADGVDAEAWLHPPSRGRDDGATLALSHVDPDADFSYDYADLAFTRLRDCP
ncbi:serine hydrolase domain-containing protein [Pseudoxanthomonas koreensis]|uniref:serine hydrolase domain-containing protein n=1 Tax=Pseudoxanthomonas koreensis TaxID=266061 RepID=UPI001390A3D9|nr:serine hydrolase domain-containing protein [Pseudoxanthomonas koreensis]KAF1694592.1 penicillin-binding protein [Pseudoxanthomonas koreensis]